MALFPQDKQIVIVGGGYAGIHAAAVLAWRLKGKGGVRVVLVSDHEYFLDRCRLHEAAVRNTAICYPLSPMFNGTCVDVSLGSVDRVNLEERRLHVAHPSHGYEIPFDALFVATGTTPNDFGIAGVKENARFLSNYEDTVAIRSKVESLSGGNVIVVGGGLTGIELAAELAELAQADEADAPRFHVTLLEGADRLLPACDEREAEYCHERLSRMRVSVRTGAQVERLEEKSALLKDGTQLPHDLVVWCAGIRASAPEGLSAARTDRAGRIETDDLLELRREPLLLAGGDLISCTPVGAERPLAAKAMWAVQMGEYAGEALAAWALGEDAPPAPVFQDKGELISLGQRDACGIAQVGPVRQFLSGFPAVLLKDASLTYHLWGLAGRTGVAPGAQPVIPRS